VVRAGLIPALRRLDGERVWEIATLLPGAAPLKALASALVPLFRKNVLYCEYLQFVGLLSVFARDMAVVPAQGCTPAIYRPKDPANTLLYRVVQEHFETYLSLSTEGWDDNPVPAYVEREFRRYLECGILAHGFARARCPECGHDFLVAFSCKGRGVCPSCNARRMAETAAHLVDHVFPPLPVRQWVLSLPKRLRYFLRQNRKAVTAVLNIFLRVVEQVLREHAPDGTEKGRLGAVSFVHRFGSALNEHTHFHCCVIDGVFELGPGGEETVRLLRPALV